MEMATPSHSNFDIVRGHHPVDVVGTAVVVVVVIAGASVVGCSSFACPMQMPTFPAWSTATSFTVCSQQEALKVTMVTFSPACPTLTC